MIDTHCHLTDRAFTNDVDEVIQRSFKNGVKPLITISDSLNESQKNIDISKRYPHDIFCTIGIHPHNAKDWDDSYSTKLNELSKDPTVKGIGEIGLDYYYDNSPRDIQRNVFQEQLCIAKDLNLPAVIHTREAIDDTWNIVRDINPDRCVLHCCSEKWDDVKQFVERGYFLSFTGICTFKRSDVIRDTIKQCPIEQIMVETDAPYLAPDPYRGRRCEPTHVIDVAECVADLKGVTLEEVDEITTSNAQLFFNLPIVN